MTLVYTHVSRVSTSIPMYHAITRGQGQYTAVGYQVLKPRRKPDLNTPLHCTPRPTEHRNIDAYKRDMYSRL